jgi:hypothetical protein
VRAHLDPAHHRRLTTSATLTTATIEGETMAHRPYPNRDRALRQLTRHPRTEADVPPALRPFVQGVSQFRENARRAVEAWPVGEYRLSTR